MSDDSNQNPPPPRDNPPDARASGDRTRDEANEFPALNPSDFDAGPNGVKPRVVSDTAPTASLPPMTTAPETGDPDSIDHAYAEPPRSQSKLTPWLLLLLCLAMASPALLLELSRPDVIDAVEARTIAIAMHTQQQRGDADAWFTPEMLWPVLNGQPQLGDPPLVSWLQRLALPNGVVVNQPVDTIVWRVRLVSVAMGMLMLGSVFWIGMSVGGRTVATFAALMCLANPIFVIHARMAAPPIFQAAFTALAIAAALWAVRPFKPASSVERQFIGWVTCGLATGAAVLSIGPLAAIDVALPIVVILCLCPGRFSHTLGLLAALLIATLMVIPWFMHAHEQDTNAWQVWADQVLALRSQTMGQTFEQAKWRTLALLVGLLPWTIWIFAGVAQPFSASSGGSRRRMFLGWTWAVIAALVLTLRPGSARGGQILTILPAAAVLIGLLFDLYTSLASEGRYPRIWRLTRWPHLLLMVLLSAGVPAVLYLQPALISRGWLQTPLAMQPAAWMALAMAIALLGIVFLSIRTCYNHFPGKSMVLWAVWTLGVVIVATLWSSRGDAARSAYAAAGRLAELPPSAQVLMLTDQPDEDPAPHLLLYGRRPIVPVTREAIDDLEPPFFVITRFDAETLPPQATRLGDAEIADLHLWYVDAPPPPPVTPQTPPADAPSQTQPANDDAPAGHGG